MLKVVFRLKSAVEADHTLLLNSSDPILCSETTVDRTSNAHCMSNSPGSSVEVEFDVHQRDYIFMKRIRFWVNELVTVEKVQDNHGRVCLELLTEN